MSEFSQQLVIHPWRLRATCAWLPAFRDGLILSLKEVILDNQTALGPLFASRCYAMGFFQADPQTGQSLLSWSPGVWCYCLPCSIRSGTWPPPFHGPVAKAAPSLHIPDQSFLLNEYQVKQSSIKSSRAGHNWKAFTHRSFEACLWNELHFLEPLLTFFFFFLEWKFRSPFPTTLGLGDFYCDMLCFCRCHCMNTLSLIH